MSRVRDALTRFRLAPNTAPTGNPFRLVSSVSPSATAIEVEAAWGPREMPDDVTNLWSACRSARLFEDADFGQWGLVLLDPQASRARTEAERLARQTDFRDGDVVVGEFLGDQELLVVAPSESGVRRVLIALPLDPRDDWFGAAPDLARFLEAYFDAGGNKYWETGPA